MPAKKKTKIPQPKKASPAKSIDIEEIIRKYSVLMGDEFPKIARSAQSEEDVRHECNKHIDEFLAEAKIEVKGRHEYGLAGGQIDSKYGGVIIEYKNPKGPGKITLKQSSAGNKAVIKQIKQRFKDFQIDEHIEPERIFAIGCDGNNFIFIRHRGNKFEVEEPQPATRHTVERTLRALVSLGARGHSFTPELLAEYFGSDSPNAEKCIRDIYAVIAKTKNKKALTFFKQWKILFGEVCGYDVEGKNEKISKLGDHYLISKARPAELLFSVHTYYAIFMKFLAAEIASSFSPLGLSIIKKCVGAPTSGKLKREMENLEQGGIWSQLGITNFLEGDLFSWYLSAWDKKIETAVRSIVGALDNFDPTTLSVEPAESRDLLKKLYQRLFPKSVRHDLGEYYTPDWLAEHVLNELGYDGNPDKRLLDPACGSGTFLVMAINRVKSWYAEHRHECGFGEKELVQKILKNIIGFDLNPLAVMAARTNYLLAIRDLLQFASGIELPVYLCDAIMTPAEYGKEELLQHTYGNVKELKTSAGSFYIPEEVVNSRELMGKYAETIEFCVRNKYDADDFIARCKSEGLPVKQDKLHRELYEKLRKLDAENQNGIWARIIKNAFAPIFIGRVDYLAGNPPWIGWEHLPDNYRDTMKPLWQNYGLFSLSGSAGRLGGGQKDLSMLFVYAGIDNYLAYGGKLGFVITQTIFKSKDAGDGFRQFGFTAKKEKVVIKPRIVHDMGRIQVFEGATNHTAVFICEKNEHKFSYPVPYVIWRGPSRIGQEHSLAQVNALTQRSKLGAIPVDSQKETSPWLTAPKNALSGIKKVVGKSDYTAHLGVNAGGLSGCYWVEVIKKCPDGNVIIHNLKGKIKVPKVQAVIEPDLVYPLLHGIDVSRWNANPSRYIILAQDPEKRIGIPESKMKRDYPKTFAYLKQFEQKLRNRPAYKKYFKPTDPFYSMYNVGPYTMAPWKVLWNRIDTKIQSVFVGHTAEKLILCQETHTFVTVDSPNEGYYFSAAFNSSPCDLLVRSYSGSKGFASSHVMKHVKIARFEPRNNIHKKLVDLSRKCHKAAAKGDTDKVAILEAEIDEAAAKLWGITDSELKAIQNALKKR